MYQSLNRPRTYKHGINTGLRSYTSYLGIQSEVSYALTNLSPEEVAESVCKGLGKSSGLVVAEQVRQMAVKLKSNNFSSKFARMINAMKKLKKENKGRNKARRKINNPSDMEGIETMTEEFHGRPPKESIDVEIAEEYEDRLAILADLLELTILSNSKDKLIIINFTKNRPKLTCDAEGKNLQLVGGDQELDLAPENYGGKELIPIGPCVSVAYETDKHHLMDSTGTVDPYEHYFGEEYYKEHGYTGRKFFNRALADGVVADAERRGYLPIMIYDTRNQRILFTGGRYKVEDVGIRD